MVHSDNAFAAVSYLRVKGVTLEGKPESGNDLTVPPLLEPDFTRIRVLLRGDHSVDSSIRAVSESVTCQSTVQSRGSSGSRRGGWVVVGDVFCEAGQDIPFEEEVAQCFCDLQGSPTPPEEMSF